MFAKQTLSDDILLVLHSLPCICYDKNTGYIISVCIVCEANLKLGNVSRVFDFLFCNIPLTKLYLLYINAVISHQQPGK